METKIYERMHKDNRENYASYFKVEFLGSRHTYDFQNKTFIMRGVANEDTSSIMDELIERYDEDLTFIDETWPTEE